MKVLLDQSVDNYYELHKQILKTSYAERMKHLTSFIFCEEQ